MPFSVLGCCTVASTVNISGTVLCNTANLHLDPSSSVTRNNVPCWRGGLRIYVFSAKLVYLLSTVILVVVFSFLILYGFYA